MMIMIPSSFLGLSYRSKAVYTILLPLISSRVTAFSLSSSSSSSSVSSFVRSQKFDEDDDDGSASTVLLEKKNSLPIKIKIKFVLIDTINPGNIGSSARSMKTMGFTKNLILVNPKDERVLGRKRTKESASGAIDVLKNAKLVTSVEDALRCEFDTEAGEEENSDNDDDNDDTDNSKTHNNNKSESNNNKNYDKSIINIVCGTGMPINMSRERQPITKEYIPPRQFFEDLFHNYQSTTTTTTIIYLSILFGNEKYGMNRNDIEECCDVMLGIPTNPKFGSLNLASTVQLIAYDCRIAMGGF